jgi:hypothetical protein
MSANIYCDVGDVPKGKKRGSMKQCAEKGQIKYYGEKKVDKKIIDSLLDKKNSKKSGNIETQLDNLKLKLVGMMGKVKNLTRKIDNEDDSKESKKLEKERKTLDKEIEKAKEKAVALKKKIEKQKGGKKSSKSSSKASSKKSSRKRMTGGANIDAKNDAKKNAKKNEDFTWICDYKESFFATRKNSLPSCLSRIASKMFKKLFCLMYEYYV